MHGGPGRTGGRRMTWALLAVGVVAVLTLVGVLLTGADGDAGSSAATGSAPAVPSATGGEVPPVSGGGDATEELRAAAGAAVWGAAVVSAEQTAPGRVEVRTSIAAAGPEVQQALAVCEGAVAWLQAQGATDPSVDVLAADGTGLARSGHPAGECTGP
ncbi:hypothetical protein ACI79J_18800 [Geodermatophilus sp. SYSU D01062]